jgi:hypothetical protein
MVHQKVPEKQAFQVDHRKDPAERPFIIVANQVIGFMTETLGNDRTPSIIMIKGR